MGKVLVVGSVVVDLTFVTEHLPKPGETLMGRFTPGLGGKGFNQAVSARLSGAATRFLGAVGKDSFSSGFRNRLEELGIEYSLEEFPDHSTGAAAISVCEAGENNIIVSLGANEMMSPGFLESREEFFKDIAVLLLQFETNMNVIERSIELTRRHSPAASIILNPAPAREKISREILENIDYLTPNETELSAITGRELSSEHEILDACADIPTPGAVLVTLGENGALHYQRSETGTSQFHAILPYKVKAVDTSGAGDAFNGAFAFGICEWGSWKKAARYASAAAALSVMSPGTSASFRDRPFVEKFLYEREGVV